MANALLFLAIPTGRFVDKYPANLSLAFGCGGDGHALLTDLDSKSCGFQPLPAANLSLTVTECGYVCYDEIHRWSRLENAKESLPADWPSVDQPYKKFRHGIFLNDTWRSMGILFGILLGMAIVLFEGACLADLIEYKGDLGLQRVFAIVSTMIFSPVSGALIHHFSFDL